MAGRSTGAWIVEVRKGTPAPASAPWVRVTECADGDTAIAVADALHNLAQSGVIGIHLLQVRTRVLWAGSTGGGCDGG